MKQITIAAGIKAYYGISPEFIVITDGECSDLVSMRKQPVLHELIEELMAAAEE